jgi:hypothetical protein
VRRVLLLFHDPYHRRAEEARSWLEQEIAAILQPDGLQRAKLTRLDVPSSGHGGFDWLLELQAAPGADESPRGALAAMVGDLRLLGMAPLIAVADDQNAVELEAQ